MYRSMCYSDVFVYVHVSWTGLMHPCLTVCVCVCVCMCCTPHLQLATIFYDELECYKEAFKKKYPDKNPDNLVDVTFKEGYVYDSIWSIALALNRTIEQGIALENFTYKNVEMADIIQEELRNSNFLGISVSVVLSVIFHVLCVCVHMSVILGLRVQCWCLFRDK